MVYSESGKIGTGFKADQHWESLYFKSIRVMNIMIFQFSAVAFLGTSGVDAFLSRATCYCFCCSVSCLAILWSCS